MTSQKVHHHHHHVDHNGELIQEQDDSEFLPALGLSNPSDLAYRAMDILMGIASIIPEDYPFVCICQDDGKCSDQGATRCPSRVGQKAAAVRAPLGVATVLAAIVAFTLS